ncbi:MAG TPA: hypothetical protein VM736_15640, partial [Gemmatimonadales bacterium]|nr:hypothetical protein [Gemmatimonadales bacterium]
LRTRFESWLFFGGILAYGPALLFLDAHVPATWPGQYLLGVLPYLAQLDSSVPSALRALATPSDARVFHIAAYVLKC